MSVKKENVDKIFPEFIDEIEKKDDIEGINIIKGLILYQVATKIKGLLDTKDYSKLNEYLEDQGIDESDISNFDEMTDEESPIHEIHKISLTKEIRRKLYNFFKNKKDKVNFSLLAKEIFKDYKAENNEKNRKVVKNRYIKIINNFNMFLEENPKLKMFLEEITQRGTENYNNSIKKNEEKLDEEIKIIEEQTKSKEYKNMWKFVNKLFSIKEKNGFAKKLLENLLHKYPNGINANSEQELVEMMAKDTEIDIYGTKITYKEIINEANEYYNGLLLSPDYKDGVTEIEKIVPFKKKEIKKKDTIEMTDHNSVFEVKKKSDKKQIKVEIGKDIYVNANSESVKTAITETTSIIDDVLNTAIEDMKEKEIEKKAKAEAKAKK